MRFDLNFTLEQCECSGKNLFFEPQRLAMCSMVTSVFALLQEQ